MVASIKCFGVILPGANSIDSLESFYGKVLYSVSRSWIGAYDKLKHQENFFIVAPAGVTVDDDYIYNNIHLCDSLSISILANCSLSISFEL